MSKEEIKALMDGAIADIKVAENHLNFAEKEYIDVAILELSAAMKKLEVIVNQMKKAGQEWFLFMYITEMGRCITIH